MADPAGSPVSRGPPRRPDVLAYPAPTTARFVIFVAALLSAGAFVGGWVHNQLFRDEWLRTDARCEQQALRGPPAPGVGGSFVRSDARAQSCRASIERRRAAWIFGGAGLTGLAAVALLLATPRVLERRRGLHAPGPRLAPAVERFCALSREAGITRSPTVVLGSLRARDAFSYGRPGRYRVALPPAVAVRWRDSGLFDPVAGHELAHIRHHDVALAWLSRSVWYVVAPLLAVPVVVAVTSSDVSLLPDYAWRAALLALTVQLVAAGLLRSREHDADLRAAQGPPGPEGVARVVALTDGARGRGRRRVLAKHPARDARLAILRRPELAAQVTFLDALTAAFLAALSIPLVVSAFTALLTGSQHVNASLVVAACLAGPLLGASVGLGLCRAALVGRAVGAARSPIAPALGVAAGLVLGQAASLAQTGVGTRGFGPVAFVAATAVLGAGATVLVAGLGELLAEAAPRFRTARASWVVALIAATAVFIAALWIVATLETLVRGGSVILRLWLVTGLASWVVLAALAITVAIAVVALAVRTTDAVPAWAVEGPEPAIPRAQSAGRVGAVLATGALIGLIFALAHVLYRVAAGPAGSTLQRETRLYMAVWLAAAAAAGALIVVVAGPRGRGLGAGVVAGAVASVVTVAGSVTLNTALGGRLSASFSWAVAKPGFALGFGLLIVGAPVAALLGRLPRAAARWRFPVLAVTCAGLAAVIVAERRPLYPAAAIAAIHESAVLRGTDERVQELLYITHEAPRIAGTTQAAQVAVNGVAADAGAGLATRAAEIEARALGPLRARLAEAVPYRTTSSRVRTLHAEGIAAMRAMVRQYDAYVALYRGAGPRALTVSRVAQADARRHLDAWIAGMVALRGASGAP